ncbi:MAG: GWxTD domain-containing protein [Candidatus Zixiibacteriota bacterium]|nr:MAG: GWxTD domain-containing protein [candidate division Zixibacteria bacterium]
MRLLNREGYAIDSSKAYFSVRAASPVEAKKPNIRVFYSVGLLVPPGVYSARLTVIDAVSKRQGDVFYDRVLVTLPPHDRIHIGGAAMAFNIFPVGDDSLSRLDPLVKNGLKVLVNPLRIFSVDDSVIYFYAELYNLSHNDAQARHRLRFTALDSHGDTYREFGFVERRSPGPAAVVAEPFDVGSWPAGKYTLRLIATDLETKAADTLSLNFRLTGSAAQLASFPTATAQSATPGDTLPLATEIHLVKYLLTPDEQTTLDRLTPDGQRNFLARFWREHDENPQTERNETKEKYLKRFAYANKHFSTNVSRTNGWLTDRGRIYITRGPADRIKRADVPALANPFEVWYYYNYKEGAFYVFEDDQVAFEYRLVHSNVDGEKFDKNWDRIIKDQELLEDF